MFDIMVGMINMTVLVALICIGVIIKQSPIFDKVANEYIPLILLVFCSHGTPQKIISI